MVEKKVQIISELDTKDIMLPCENKSPSFNIKSCFNISIVTESLSVLGKDSMHRKF